MTGAAGFIGSHVVDALTRKKSIVTAVVSPKTSQEKIKKNLALSLKNISIQKADLTVFKDCLKIAKGQDIVLHLAAMDGGKAFKIKYGTEIFRVNIQMVLNMLEAARIEHVKRFLLQSSIDIYTPSNLEILKDNQSLNGCKWSKTVGELAAKMYSEQYGLKIAIARPGNVYGPRDYSSGEKQRVIPAFISHCLREEKIEIWDDANAQRPFLYVTDLVDALCKLTALYAVCDPVNIASKKIISLGNLARLIGKIAQKEVKLQFDKTVASYENNINIDIEKAKKVISFKENVSLEKGLAETIEYFKKLYK